MKFYILFTAPIMPGLVKTTIISQERAFELEICIFNKGKRGEGHQTNMKNSLSKRILEKVEFFVSSPFVSLTLSSFDLAR